MDRGATDNRTVCALLLAGHRPSPGQADVIVGIIESVLAGFELSPEQYERGREPAVARLVLASREPPGWY